MGHFDGRTVVVTGGGGALGVAVTRRLLDEGARVHVPAYGTSDPAQLEPLHCDNLHVATEVNLADEGSVKSFYDSVPSLWASIHLVGGFTFGAFEDAAFSDFEKMVSMNIRSTWLCCRAAVRKMSGEETGGRIVNVAARPVLEATAEVATYAMTKGAVATLTRCLGVELAPKNILVNAIAPSLMDTPANRESMPGAEYAKWPKVDEVAATIRFLASAENTLTWGEVVPVYGRA